MIHPDLTHQPSLEEVSRNLTEPGDCYGCRRPNTPFTEWKGGRYRICRSCMDILEPGQSHPKTTRQEPYYDLDYWHEQALEEGR